MNQVEVKRRQIQLISMSLSLLVIWIFGKSIGDNGVAYLTAALEGFAFWWLVISGSVSDMLGKMLRSRNGKGQYRNAAKMRSSILVFQGILGLAGSGLFLLLSQFISEAVFKLPHSRFVMMILAPAVFLRSLSAVLLGIFQGEGSELPTALTGVLRQLLILGFGLIFVRIMVNYGEKVSSLLKQEVFVSVYGAMGAALAVLTAELFIILLLILIYKGSNSTRRKKDEEGGMKTTDSFEKQVFCLHGGRGVSLLFGLLLLLPLWLGAIFYQRCAAEPTAYDYGLYIGKYLVLCGGVSTFLMALALPGGVKAINALRKEDARGGRSIFQSNLKAVWASALYFAGFCGVLSKQLAGLLSENSAEKLAEMLAAGSVLIVFGVTAYFCYVILKHRGKQIGILGAFAAADLVFAVLLVFCLKKSGIMALVYGGVVWSGILAAALCILACRRLRTGVDKIRMLAIPVGNVCAIGLLQFMLGKVLTPHLGNLITVLVSLVISWLLYWGVLLFLRCFEEKEIYQIPGGKILHGMGQLLGVF